MRRAAASGAIARLPLCNQCGVELKCLHRDVCPDCGDGIVILECPSCLGQEEFLHLENEDIHLHAYCHRERGRITEMGFEALVRLS